MLNRLSVILALVLVLVAPAYAQLANDDDITADAEGACMGAFNLCWETCALSSRNEVWKSFCRSDCQSNLNSCLPDEVAGPRGAQNQTNIPDSGVLDPRNTDDSDLFNISLVSSARLESACSKVSGARFSRTERSYGCLNTCGGPRQDVPHLLHRWKVPRWHARQTCERAHLDRHPAERRQC